MNRVQFLPTELRKSLTTKELTFFLMCKRKQSMEILRIWLNFCFSIFLNSIFSKLRRIGIHYLSAKKVISFKNKTSKQNSNLLKKIQCFIEKKENQFVTFLIWLVIFLKLGNHFPMNVSVSDFLTSFSKLSSLSQSYKRFFSC